MLKGKYTRIGVAALLAVILIGGVVLVFLPTAGAGRVNVTAFFANSNGVFDAKRLCSDCQSGPKSDF